MLLYHHNVLRAPFSNSTGGWVDGASFNVWICATIVQLYYFIVRLSLSHPKARTAFSSLFLGQFCLREIEKTIFSNSALGFPTAFCVFLSTGNRNAGTKDTKSCDGENKFDGIKSKRNCRSSIALIWRSPSNVHPTTLTKAAYVVRSGGVVMGRGTDFSPYSFSGKRKTSSALPTTQIIPSGNGTQQQGKRANERKANI